MKVFAEAKIEGTSTRSVVCPKCGTRNSAALDFCGKCGMDLEYVIVEPSASDGPESTKRNTDAKIWDGYREADADTSRRVSMDRRGDLLTNIIGPLDTLAAIVMLGAYAWMLSISNASPTDLVRLANQAKLAGAAFGFGLIAFAFLTLLAIYLLSSRD